MRFNILTGRLKKFIKWITGISNSRNTRNNIFNSGLKMYHTEENLFYNIFHTDRIAILMVTIEMDPKDFISGDIIPISEFIKFIQLASSNCSFPKFNSNLDSPSVENAQRINDLPNIDTYQTFTVIHNFENFTISSEHLIVIATNNERILICNFESDRINRNMNLIASISIPYTGLDRSINAYSSEILYFQKLLNVSVWSLPIETGGINTGRPIKLKLEIHKLKLELFMAPRILDDIAWTDVLRNNRIFI